jgi:four helix bundle protein
VITVLSGLTGLVFELRGAVMSGTYEDRKAWQSLMELTFDIYAATRTLPREQIYGPTNQTRRASAAIGSNIAEGKGGSWDKEFVPLLSRARGSLCEVQTQLKIPAHPGYLNQGVS